MYESLLGALLLGMFPTFSTFYSSVVSPQEISVAPPAQELSIEDHISASGIVIMDVNSGQQIFKRQETAQRPMASLTKLMTALIIVENHDLEEMVTIPVSINGTVGNVAYLPAGHRYEVGDLLSALLINSANDAAKVLAIYHSGSVPAFVEEMNLRARSLGLKATSFHNPDGLDHPAHWSTPQDVAWLTSFAFRYPEISLRMGRKNSRIISSKGGVTNLSHTHALLHKNDLIVGGKTGTTSDAGQCLVSVVETEEGGKYIVVLFKSNQRYEDTKTILSALQGEEVEVESVAQRSR